MMRNLMMLKAMATGSVLVLAGLPTHVAAQEASGCVCSAPLGSIGIVGAAQGQVLVSQAAGFVPAAQGGQLSQGGRVIVGPQSTALVSLGAGCSVTLTENMEATISGANGELCLSASNTLPAGESADASNGSGVGFGPPEMLFLGAVGGAVTLSAFDEKEAVSQ